MWIAYLSDPLLDLALASIARTLSDTAFPRQDRTARPINRVDFLYFQHTAKARSGADSKNIPALKTAKTSQFPKKTEKNRRKPVEMRCFPLTNAAESRKVNGGRVSLDPHQCLRSSHFVR
jgi:hypothetical protein